MSPHQRHQSPADGQTKTDTPRCHYIHISNLDELLKNGLALVGAYADPRVMHGKYQLYRARASMLDRNIHCDGTSPRELDGIVDQIHQDLEQPPLIASEFRRHIRSHIRHDIQVLYFGAEAQEVDDLVDHIKNIEDGLFAAQAAGINHRDIKHTIGNFQQNLIYGLNLPELVALHRILGVGNGDFHQAGHGRQRRADFMACVGKKLGCGLLYLMEARLCLGQTGIGPPQFQLTDNQLGQIDKAFGIGFRKINTRLAVDNT